MQLNYLVLLNLKQLESTESKSASNLSLKQLQPPHRPNNEMNVTQSPHGSSKVQRSISATNSKGRRYSHGGESTGPKAG